MAKSEIRAKGRYWAAVALLILCAALFLVWRENSLLRSIALIGAVAASGLAVSARSAGTRELASSRRMLAARNDLWRSPWYWTILAISFCVAAAGAVAMMLDIAAVFGVPAFAFGGLLFLLMLVALIIPSQ